jgi:SMC interacting uncharacterized protein involved in chromosome segregation
MFDKLEELDTLVAQLADRQREARQEIMELRSANEALQRQAAEAEGFAEENRVLREKVKALEEELTSFSGREGEIRQRLQSILERIASLESEVQDAGVAPQ